MFDSTPKIRAPDQALDPTASRPVLSRHIIQASDSTSPQESLEKSMTAQRVATMAFIVMLASNVGFSQVKTTMPDVVPGRGRSPSSVSTSRT
jgi:hypothetical protein